MPRSQPSHALAQSYLEHHPTDAARVLERFGTEEVGRILSRVAGEQRAHVVEALDPHFAAAVCEGLGDDEARETLRIMAPERAADILFHLDEERREKLLAGLEMAHSYRSLLSFDPETAGGVMNPRVAAVTNDLRVRDVIRRLRELAARRFPVDYVYVVDQTNRLVGVLMMRELVLQDPNTPVEQVMIRNVFTVPVDLPVRDVIDKLREKRLVAIPVVDQDGRLLGAAKTQDLLTSMEQESYADIQKMFGAGEDEQALWPIHWSMSKRLPWLQVNLLTAFLAAAVVAIFESTIAEITALAVLMPVVAGQGGNTGSQALAVVLRGLALREVTVRDARRVILREGALGLLNGLAVAVTVTLVVFVSQDDPSLALVIGIAMIGTMFAAGIAGAAIPMGLRAMGFDPAQSAGIVLTTVTDVVGFGTFLGLATLARGWMM
ncbi:MAG: magnesium transporter [Gemmatimonadetes bacterium]|nr:magnesium transporter [Gemmatimonadota bacterium]